MEADFCPLPDNVCDEHGLWLGLVVDHGFGLILMTSILDEPPIVQDLLEILSRAMECPLPYRHMPYAPRCSMVQVATADAEVIMTAAITRVGGGRYGASWLLG